MAIKIHNAYLAGLIDGEGYLGLLPSRVKGLVNQSFTPVIKIGMTGESSRKIFVILQEEFGGYVEKRNGFTKGNREAWTYHLRGRKRVIELLTSIYPYLLVKQSQAKILLEFCNLSNTHSLYNNFDSKILDRKIEIYNELKQLKLPEPLATTE